MVVTNELLEDTKKQLEILSKDGVKEGFFEKIRGPLQASSIDIFQMNLGNRCNLACRHCHVSAGPDKKSFMSRPVLEKSLAILRESPIPTVDLTGGSPEMNPHFRWFIEEAAKLKKRLIVRSNLVILLDEGFKDIPDLYVKNNVEVVTSLPSFDEDKADRQRGHGFLLRFIKAVQLLNEKGYGHPDTGLVLSMVHNPTGAYLPASQKSLHNEYARVLKERHGLTFNNLYCITNMPIGRFLLFLLKTDNYDDYMETLVNAFNPAALENVMCRNTLSVGWNGTLYDCDFNQMLHLPVDHSQASNIMDFDYERLKNRRIVIGNHCYGCTAGAGSSCQGEIAQ